MKMSIKEFSKRGKMLLSQTLPSVLLICSEERQTVWSVLSQPMQLHASFFHITVDIQPIFIFIQIKFIHLSIILWLCNTKWMKSSMFWADFSKDVISIIRIGLLPKGPWVLFKWKYLRSTTLRKSRRSHGEDNIMFAYLFSFSMHTLIPDKSSVSRHICLV